MKSNITIKSNVYIRDSAILPNDINFVKNVRGAKAIKKVDSMLSTLSRARLTHEQLYIKTNGLSCVLAKDGQSTHGTVMKNGKIESVCRCEYSQCLHYETSCKASIQPLNRNFEIPIVSQSTQYGIDLNSIEDGIGIDYSEDDIFKTNTPILNSESNDVETPLTEASQLDTSTNGYTKLSSKGTVIESSIDSKILINAGAGTGKTYTVINRVLYLLKNGLVSPDEILVISYTRSAKKVIEDRIATEVTNGDLPYSALSINLFTLDSLATNYLLSYIDEDITKLNYDERITLFNEKVSRESFDVFKYIIVDEIQDLVNVRATMLLKILECTSCGYMLLGDKCQAIYDYSCNGEVSISSSEFYRCLEEYIYQENALKYEFTENMRQDRELLQLTSQLRKSILNGSVEDQQDTLNSIVSNLEVYETPAENVSSIETIGKTAILTRNNGEAEHIHTTLLEHGVEHTIYRGNHVKPYLHRDFATIFWDYCKPSITKENFILRYKYRVCDDSQQAEEYFSTLQDISNCENPLTLDMGALIKVLQTKHDLPETLLADIDYDLVVSTIHKAKGQEFDTVYLLDDTTPLGNEEEIRVKYVSLTRAKSNLKLLKKRYSGYWYFKSSKLDGRVISCSNHYKNTYCSGVSFGLNGEVEKSSFVTNISSTFHNSLELQEYIATSINSGDTVDLVLTDGTYYIYHMDNIIGKMSEEFNRSLKKAMRSVTYKSKLPIKITDVQVANVVTFIDTSYFDTDFPIYKQSKIFFGLELSGIGHAQYK